MTFLAPLSVENTLFFKQLIQMTKHCLPFSAEATGTALKVVSHVNGLGVVNEGFETQVGKEKIACLHFSTCTVCDLMNKQTLHSSQEDDISVSNRSSIKEERSRKGFRLYLRYASQTKGLKFVVFIVVHTHQHNVLNVDSEKQI